MGEERRKCKEGEKELRTVKMGQQVGVVGEIKDSQ